MQARESAKPSVEPGKFRRVVVGVREEIYRAVVERGPVGILIYDPETKAVLYANLALRDMLLYGPGELPALHDLIANDRGGIDAWTARVLGAGQGHAGEVWLRRRDGSLARAARLSGVISYNGRVAVCDLFATGEAGEEPRGSAAFAQAAIDSLSAHVAILDEAGTIVATNRPWRRFAEANGASPAEVSENVNYLTVCDAAAARNCADAAAFARGMRAVLSGRRQAFELEYPCHSPTERRWFVGRVTRFAGTEPPWAVVSHENVTERKRAEQERERLRGGEIAARTQREERLRISRDLHDMVLQDLSGALQSLRLAHLRAKDSGAPLDLGEELAALRRATAGLRGAILDLRHEENLTFVGSVEALVELNRRAVPERRISLVIEGGFPEVLPGEAGVELLRVLQEALANVRRHSGAENVRLRLFAAGDEALVELTDDGRGFEPGGVREGVGLAAMRERVEGFGGAIEVSSSPGEGTRLLVRVPLGDDTPGPPPG
jgi:signal transduction histidine kinase